MQSGGRKRVVTSCIPCYRKKQKCNRRYPCNHCARRRQPEDCIYHSFQASQTPQTGSHPPEEAPADHDAESQDASGNDHPVGTSSDWGTKTDSAVAQGNDSLSELFGYVQYSESNTMALVRRLGLDEEGQQCTNREIPREAFDDIEKNIKRLPAREIFDFLVQYYVTEVHWMEQLIYVPWFLGQYQKWWSLGRLSLVLDVEFAVLFLRICVYASQFLPSPSYTIDRIRGMPLTDIRNACYDIAEKLAIICERLDARGTLLRVQHLLVLGLQWQCEGRITAFWEALSNAIRVAQRIGLPRGRTAWISGMHEFDMEIRCRVFCNLYIWDSLLSRQLDYNPLLASSLSSEQLPRMHLAPDDTNAPESYSERLMQARLGNFWRNFAPKQSAEYEATMAEERYEKFCSDYLANLPPVLALEPNEEWDERLQKLPLQRQILHITVFDSLCHNFRPILMREPNQVRSLPTYKQILETSQRRTLAAAALKMLDGVSKLHTLLGRSHTRFATIILPTFEAAIVLVSLIMDEQFPGTNLSDERPLRAPNVDPLGWEKAHLTRDRCHQAVQEALARLEMLAEVSTMAETSARTLARLMAKTPYNLLEACEPSNLDNFFTAYSADTV